MTRKSPTRMPFSWHLHRALPNRFRRNAAVGGAESPPGTCHQHGRVLVTTTVTSVGTLLGLIPAMQAGVSLWGLLWCPLPGGKWEGGVAATQCHRSWGADTHHGGTVTLQAGMCRAGRGRCARGQSSWHCAPGCGMGARGAPGQVLGPLSPRCSFCHCLSWPQPGAIPAAVRLPGPRRGPSPLPWGSQCDTKWGPDHQEMAQTGSHKRTHRCPSAWAGGTSMASARAAVPVMAAPQGGLVGVPFPQSLSPQWPSGWH